MVDKRDVQLLIRANDLSSKPLKDIAAAVDQLNESLARQVSAAQQGKASLAELKQTLTQLEAAGKALAQQQGLIDLYSRLGARLAEAQAKALAAREAFNTFKDSLAAGADQSAKQTRELEKLGRAADRAEVSALRAAAAIAKQKSALEAVGVDTNNLTASQDALVAAAGRVGAAITAASTAMASFGDNARKAKAATDLAGFRGLADQAQAGVQGSAALPGVASRGGLDSTAASLRAVVDPAAAARATLNGVEQEIRQLGAAAGSAEGTVQQYASVLRGLQQASSALLSQGAGIDLFERQVAGVRAARQAYEEARGTFNATAAAVRNATEPNDQLAASLRRAQAAMQSTGSALVAQITRAREARVALDQAGISSKNLAAEQQRLQAAATQTAEAIRKAQTQVQRLTSPEGYTGAATIFGLRPYQLQNLGYQINDVFTQIASGTSITQTLAQQGGQIAQIFPGAFSAIARFLPVIVSIGAAAVTAFAAVNRLLDNAAALREFQGLLTASADPTRYQAQALLESQRAIQAYGASFADAGAAVRTFLQNDLNPARIVQFGKTTQDLVDVYGGKLPEAAKTVVDAFTKDYDAIVKLNESYNFLTSTQAEHIRSLFDVGQAEEARATAFDIFSKKLSDAAKDANGPWTTAIREFNRAWQDMLDTLGKSSAITGIVNVLTGAIQAATIAMRGYTGEQKNFLEAKAINQLIQERQRLETSLRDNAAAGVGQLGSFDDNRRLAELTEEIKRRSAALLAANEAIARNNSAQASNNATTKEGITTTQAANQTLDDRRDGLRSVTDATNRQTIAGDAFLRKQAEEILLGKSIRDLTKQEIEQRVTLARLKAQDAARNAGASESAAVVAGLRAEAVERAKINAELGRQGASAFDSARSREESLLNTLTSMETKVTANSKAELDQRVLQYAAAYKKIEDLVADAQRKGSTSVLGIPFEDILSRARAAAQNGALLEQMKGSEQELNNLVRERNDTIAANNALVVEGLKSETQANIENAATYEATAASIQKAADAWKSFAQQAKDAGIISETAMAAVAAKVQLVVSQTKYLDPEFKQLREDIKNAFVNNITNYFGSAFEVLGKFAAGVQSIGQTFRDLARVTAQFFASLLRDIAGAILKMYLLRAVSSFMPGLGSLFGLGGAAGGGGLGAISLNGSGAWTGGIAGGIFHGGGLVGNASPTRSISPALFANAPRYHSGYSGIGLQSDERAAILQTGEEVLSRSDPRNMKNWNGSGGGGGGPVPLKQVLVFRDEDLAGALASSAGERVLLTHISRNVPTVRSMLGIR